MQGKLCPRCQTKQMSDVCLISFLLPFEQFFQSFPTQGGMDQMRSKEYFKRYQNITMQPWPNLTYQRI